MRSLEINLASRPFHNNVPIWTAHALLAAAVVGFGAWNLRSWMEVSRKLADLQADIGSSERKLASLEAREKAAEAGIGVFDVKILQSQSAYVNDIILRRGLSWTQLFNNLERVVPYEVRMTAVRPIYGTREAEAVGRRGKSVDGTVPIVAEGVAQSLEAFLELERALIVDPHFASVEPVRTESVPGSAEVRFQLNFLYDPDGRLGQEHPEIPHVLEAARKAAEEGGEAPPGAMQESP